MKYLFFLIGLIVFTSARSQTPQPLDSLSALPFVHYFTIENGTLEGDGAEFLKRHIKEAQFFMLGEYHGSHQIQLLVKCLIPELANNGYKYYALEVGPYSATKLQSLSADPVQTVNRLQVFNSDYYRPLDDNIPIPFFSTIEEAEMLAEASRQGMKLWGIDQEYLGSTFYLFDELEQMHLNDSSLKDLKNDAYERADSFYRLSAHDDTFSLFKTLQDDPQVSLYLDRVSVVNSVAADLVKDLRASWDIYERYDRRNGTSHRTRVNLIRRNFMNYFSQVPQQTKVFCKIGALHTAESAMLNAYDIGNLTEELAQRFGTKCVNIWTDDRFYLDGEEENDSWASRYHKTVSFQLIMMGKRDSWTAIDLQGIQEKVANGDLEIADTQLFHWIKSRLENYDLMLIPPLDFDATPNYKQQDSN